MSKNLDSPWYKPSQGPTWIEFRDENPSIDNVNEASQPSPEDKKLSPWYKQPQAPAVAKWSEMKKLKHSLLRRAFDQNRGGEVILLIQWRLARERHLSKGIKEQVEAFEIENHDQPQCIRASKLLKMRGEDAGRLLYDTAVANLGDIKESTGLFSSSHQRTSQAPCP